MVSSSKDMGTLEDRGASCIEMPRVGVNDAEYWWSRASSHSRGGADRLRGGEASPRPPPAGQGRTYLPRPIDERQNPLGRRPVHHRPPHPGPPDDEPPPPPRTAEPERPQ